MRIVDLSMTVEECDSAPFAPDEKYFNSSRSSSGKTRVLSPMSSK